MRQGVRTAFCEAQLRSSIGRNSPPANAPAGYEYQLAWNRSYCSWHLNSHCRCVQCSLARRSQRRPCGSHPCRLQPPLARHLALGRNSRDRISSRSTTFSATTIQGWSTRKILPFASGWKWGWRNPTKEAGDAQNYADYRRALRRYVNGFRDIHVALGVVGPTGPGLWPGFIVAADDDGVAKVRVSEEARLAVGSQLLGLRRDGKSRRCSRTASIPISTTTSIPHSRRDFYNRLFICHFRTPSGCNHAGSKRPPARSRYRSPGGRLRNPSSGRSSKRPPKLPICRLWGCARFRESGISASQRSAAMMSSRPARTLLRSKPMSSRTSNRPGQRPQACYRYALQQWWRQQLGKPYRASPLGQGADRLRRWVDLCQRICRVPGVAGEPGAFSARSLPIQARTPRSRTM